MLAPSLPKVSASNRKSGPCSTWRLATSGKGEPRRRGPSLPRPPCRRGTGRQEERQGFASRHAAALESKLSKVVVTWDEPSANEVIDLGRCRPRRRQPRDQAPGRPWRPHLSKQKRTRQAKVARRIARRAWSIRTNVANPKAARRCRFCSICHAHRGHVRESSNSSATEVPAAQCYRPKRARIERLHGLLRA